MPENPRTVQKYISGRDSGCSGCYRPDSLNKTTRDKPSGEGTRGNLGQEKLGVGGKGALSALQPSWVSLAGWRQPPKREKVAEEGMEQGPERAGGGRKEADTEKGKEEEESKNNLEQAQPARCGQGHCLCPLQASRSGAPPKPA